MFKISKDSIVIKSLRSNGEELIMKTIQECWKDGWSPIATYRYLDEVIDWFEGVGLYEKNELRTIISDKLGDEIQCKN